MTVFELNAHLEHVQANYRNTRQLDECIERLVEFCPPAQIEAIASVRGFKKIASAARRYMRRPVLVE